MVSIVIPAYNCEYYLEDAVESVKKQTYEDWELIIIDDCSTDRTMSLAKKLSVEDNRIKVLSNSVNSGVSETRNRGVRESKAEWIAFLDSDDKWEPTKLEKQFKLLTNEKDAKLLYTGSGFMKHNGEIIDYVLHVPCTVDRKKLLKQNIISCSSVLVKRELLIKHPMPDRKMMHEDFTVWIDILAEENYAYGIDEPLLIYRLSENSKSSNKLKAALMNWNAYRYVEISLPASLYYMCCYMIKSILKYRNLR